MIVIRILLSLSVVVLASCEWDGVDEGNRPNLPPSVTITGGAVEDEQADYRVEFFWFGSDPDGFVDFPELPAGGSQESTSC